MFDELKEKVEKLKTNKWIEVDPVFKGYVGRYVEKQLGKSGDQFSVPDYKDIEIKTKFSSEFNYITLFNATPDSGVFEIKRLRDTYGYPDRDFKQFKILQNSIYGKKKTYIGSGNYFQLRVDYEKKTVVLEVYNKNKLIDDKTSWSFELLKSILERKVSKLCFFRLETKFEYPKKHFRFRDEHYLTLKDFDTFLKLIENGKVRVTFTIGIFKSGRRFGQTHDHGTGFSIHECDLFLLFDNYYGNKKKNRFNFKPFI